LLHPLISGYIISRDKMWLLKKPFSILDLLLKKKIQNGIGLFFSKLIVAL